MYVENSIQSFTRWVTLFIEEAYLAYPAWIVIF